MSVFILYTRLDLGCAVKAKRRKRSLQKPVTERMGIERDVNVPFVICWCQVSGRSSLRAFTISFHTGHGIMEPTLNQCFVKKFFTSEIFSGTKSVLGDIQCAVSRYWLGYTKNYPEHSLHCEGRQEKPVRTKMSKISLWINWELCLLVTVLRTQN